MPVFGSAAACRGGVSLSPASGCGLHRSGPYILFRVAGALCPVSIAIRRWYSLRQGPLVHLVRTGQKNVPVPHMWASGFGGQWSQTGIVHRETDEPAEQQVCSQSAPSAARSFADRAAAPSAAAPTAAAAGSGSARSRMSARWGPGPVPAAPHPSIADRDTAHGFSTTTPG